MFEPVYSGKDYVDNTNNEVLNAIAAEEAKCSIFPISCHERLGVYGIWFQYGKELLLVNPQYLVNSIYMDDHYYLLDKYTEDSKDSSEGDFYVVIQKWDNCYSWRIYHTHSQNVRQMQFTYKEYIGKIQSCISDLHNVWSNGSPIAYKPFDIGLEDVTMCKKQLAIPSVYPSHYQLMANSIVKETFVFRPVYDELFEKYEIGIGDRCYQTWFTYWDNDLEAIRHQLESYVYEHEATIKMSFDMSDTIVKLHGKRILSEISNVETGYTYKYETYILVEIIPNEFVRMPIIKGWGDEKEVIRNLYEGLLNMAYRLPLKTDEDESGHYPALLEAYNRYKSPIVESFLRGDKWEPNTYRNRQVHVKHIIRINPDYDVYLWDEEEVASTLDDDYYDQQGNPIVMPEFDEWAKEMSPIVLASETGEPYEMDWEDYHKRGLAWAHQLRQQLSTDFDLWYEAPYEDKSGTIRKRIFIL